MTIIATSLRSDVTTGSHLQRAANGLALVRVTIGTMLALWVGTIDQNQHITVLGYQTVFGCLGSALGFNGTNLLVINYNLYEFTTQPNQISSPGQNPELLPLKLLPPNLAGTI